jgi:5-methylcytosine-specific restriction protein A
MGKTKQSRRAFIESIGGTCQNWQWSWSFVNHAERFVVFGAWDINTKGRRCLILSGKWQFRKTGRRNQGYAQSKEHLRLVVEEGYTLKTFPMEWSNARKDESGDGPAVIGGFTARLSDRGVLQLGKDWYATDLGDEDMDIALAEELDSPERYSEGSRKQIYVSAVERSGKARKACVRHHGRDCVVCGFNFERVFGVLGKTFIHVHHLVPVAASQGEREIDPVRDLVPVCPNCHAMIHQVSPPMEIEDLRTLLRERGNGLQAIEAPMPTDEAANP